jgi:hypothetical protein
MMMKLALSPSAAMLLRALVAGDKTILLKEFRSTDWQSLTFIGERHEFVLTSSSKKALAKVAARCDGDTFNIPDCIVADCAAGEIETVRDDYFMLPIEALVIDE